MFNFILKHPGGKFFIESTEGTDITEAFESGHVVDSGKVEAVLQKYLVRVAETPRNSDFTFHENGFYRTLKRRVTPILKKGL